MPGILVTKWWGVAVVDDGQVLDRRDFPRDARGIADRLLRIRRGEVLEEERALARPGLHVQEARLKSLGPLVERTGLLALPPPPEAPLLREAALLVAREESRLAAGERDRFIAQSVKAMDEITRTVNTLMERLRDWYALHFPEALRRIPDQPALARLLAETPDRESVAKKVGSISAEESIGIPFAPEELAAVQGLARNLKALFDERARLEALVTRATQEVAPTLSGVVGGLIAARLIAQRNGLEKLAHAPASTVQTLGAEDALFMHLKEGKKPPKHGILFQHGLVNTAPWAQRGRLARVLATHAAMAARIDFFALERRDRSAELLTRLDAQVQRIKKQKPRPKGKGGRRP